MNSFNPDRLNNVYNVLTGWQEVMERAIADAHGVITVNSSDVAELERARKELADAHDTLKTTKGL